MCYITATEFKKHLGHYIELAKNEDVFITKNNTVLVKLSSCKKTAIDDFLDFCDELDKKPKYDLDKTDDEIILEEIKRRCGY